MPSVPLVPSSRASVEPPWLPGRPQLAQLWRAGRDRVLQRRDAAELHGLDERTLRDLGIALAEIDALVAVRARRASSAP